MSASPIKLVLGVDYTMDGDKLVFTERYHRKRGYCCNSRCRHCPYGLAPNAPPEPPLRIVTLPLRPGGKK